MIEHAEKQNYVKLTKMSETESRAVEINSDGLDIEAGSTANKIEGLATLPILVLPIVLVEGSHPRGAAARGLDRKSAVGGADIED